MDIILSEIAIAYSKCAGVRPDDEPTSDDLWAFFIERVRAHLHIVLCFSPVGDKFRTRAHKFPALINGCTVDWYLPWPAQALTAVAEHFMGSFEIQDEDCELVRESLIAHMAQASCTRQKRSPPPFPLSPSPSPLRA